MKKASRLLVPFLALLTCILPALGQAATGTPPFSTIGGGSLDQIDLGNLNVHFCIPIVNKTGRGTPFTYSLCYDSSLWTPYGSGGWVPSTTMGWTTDSPVSQSTAYLTGYLTYSEYDQPCYGYTYNGTWEEVGDVTYSQNYTYYDRFGVAHYVNYSWQVDEYWGTGGGSGYDDCNEDNNTYYYGDGSMNDNSGYFMNIDNGLKISTASGALLDEPINGTSSPGTYTDRNGNEISADGSGHFTDTLGTTALTISGTSPVTFSYTAPSGGTASYVMKYASQTVKTTFGCSGITEYGPHTIPLVSEIDLPDYSANPSSKYTFSYDAAARITSITLPTGGTISYTYTGGNNGIECSDGSTAGLTRETPDTGSSNPWKYDRTLGTSPSPNVTLITDPYGNQTNMQFQNIYLTEEDDYTGTAGGTPLRTVYNCYTTSGPPPCNNTTMSSAPSAISSFVQWGGSGGIESQTNTTYDWAGNLTEKDEYAYGSPGNGPGPLVRYTLTPYTGGSPDLLQSTTVEDGSGHTAVRILYTYDEAPITATSGTPQHVANTNSGNLTSESILISGSPGTGATLTKSFKYYDTGNLYQATDVNNALTTYHYAACGNSFPTEIDEAISGLKQYMAWDSTCNGAVQLTAKDENNQTVTTAYTDPNFWRPASVEDQLGNYTNFTYTSYNGSNFASVEGVMTFNGGSSATDVRATLDTSGRQYVSQVRQAPGSSTWDSAESDYNLAGLPVTTTMPYAAAVGAACSPAPCPGRGITYDALDRPLVTADGGGGTVTYAYNLNDVHLSEGPAPANEHTKDRQMEYDALDRLTSVCEMTTLAGSGTCGQTSTQTGYWTTYTYDLNNNLTGVTQNAQSSTNKQTRSSTYDDLSRMTSETNPENGTTSYTYDTDSTCGTSDGDLVKKVDNMGNVTCYGYDALHRVISFTYPSGSYASVTPQKHFVYDSATVNSVAMSNAEGRLAETYTCYSPCSTKLTDEGVSYTVRGEPSDVYQMTPHSGGNYFHVNETYWENGAVKKISGLSGLPAITYAVDGEGRATTVSAASGQNPVTAVAYQTANPPGNPIGSLDQVTFGSNDSDSFGYDPKTGRITSYSFKVNGQADAGTLTWNPLGTLGQLAITDVLNSTDTQTCNYTHDDLSRIAGANCGSLFSQTFSYDPFGNISKSGSRAFQPIYSTSLTNQISSVGGTSASYDANGNTLSDTDQNYTWDANGRPTSMGNVGQSSVNLAYDASGNTVEQSAGSQYTQIVYAPDGTKLALMQGTGTLVKAFVPLTGGATAVYNSTGLAYYRHSDWLGSSRLVSTPSQTVYSDTAYAPFGETYAQSGTGDPSFTGMDQDTVPNVYDFPAREYGLQTGRWPSPDPLGIGAVDPTDPQSWNRYAYVRNSPLSLTDPDGQTYLVCIGGEYVDPDVQPYCDDLPGESMDELNSYLLASGTYAQGNDEEGGIMATSSGTFNGAGMIGTYEYEGPNVDVTTVTVTADAPSLPIIVYMPVQLTDPGADGSPSGGGGGSAAATSNNQQCPSEPLHIPLKVTSPYGPRKLNGKTEFHTGVDYAAPIGTPVFAAFNGTVIESRTSTSAGNVIAIQASGNITVYMHLSSRGVSSGTVVSSGQQIGLSGNTGNSTGPHLHFEEHTPGPLYQNGVFNHSTLVAPCG